MADQKINELPTKTAPSTGDKMLMIGAAEEYQIDYDQLATAILNKLSTQSFSSLDTTSKTVLGAIDELNSKFSSIKSNTNIDDYKDPGIYLYNGWESSYTGDKPFTDSWGILIVLKWTNVPYQFCINVKNSHIYSRTFSSNQWNDWTNEQA